VRSQLEIGGRESWEFLAALHPPSRNRTTTWAEKSSPRFEVKLPTSSLVPSPLRVAPLGSEFVALECGFGAPSHGAAVPCYSAFVDRIIDGLD
jgi:hypothetical protein